MSAFDLKLLSQSKSFGGYQRTYSHSSPTLNATMKFSIYVPPLSCKNTKFPVLYFLPGVLSDEQDIPARTGFQQYASFHGICVVSPDTHPRDVHIDGETDDTSTKPSALAGYYVNATAKKWYKHYQIHSYITKELIKLVESSFDFVQAGVRSIAGHSMGGHGAILAAIKNPGLYRTVSLFAPLSNPADWPITRVYFDSLFDSNEAEIRKWDSVCFMPHYSGPPLHILVDQGGADELIDYLASDKLVDASKGTTIKVDYFLRDGYEHDYYFLQSYIKDHFDHHAKYLKQ